ncbi:hypothetical protein THAOC_11282 [Thalassiosira oceanica]|uniref:Uncharacterized protein n=1 Tax=Thalassiosira oceanica TaxID=159749 RepID=K0T2Z0_THAOC|nr:hypothetical protein THAOC_11282 [Thalassiosira oceanica]|eukprot:EJK67656.1 hypothetical protein THAOC_11282 [Thalassiosira oceanica]
MSSAATAATAGVGGAAAAEKARAASSRALSRIACGWDALAPRDPADAADWPGAEGRLDSTGDGALCLLSTTSKDESSDPARSTTSLFSLLAPTPDSPARRRPWAGPPSPAASQSQVSQAASPARVPVSPRRSETAARGRRGSLRAGLRRRWPRGREASPDRLEQELAAPAPVQRAVQSAAAGRSLRGVSYRLTATAGGFLNDRVTHIPLAFRPHIPRGMIRLGW